MTDAQLTKFAAKLLALPSFEPATSQVPDLLFNTLQQHGAAPKKITSQGITNIVAETAGKPMILFNGHWDTVLPEAEWNDRKKLSVKQSARYVYGLGACDMKSGVAAMVAAYIDCVKYGVPGVRLCLVGDEELGGGHGTQVLVKKGWTAPHVVLGEPTNLAVSLGQKGNLDVTVTAAGTAAHAAYINRGDNAILKLTGFINRIAEAYTLPYVNSMIEDLTEVITASVNMINGGSSENVIPASASAKIDFRLPGGYDHQSLINDLETVAKDYHVTVSNGYVGQGWKLDKTSSLHQLARQAITAVTKHSPKYLTKLGTNDGKYYAPHGCQIINIGPGDNKLSHTIKEKVKLADLHAARHIYFQLAQNV